MVDKYKLLLWAAFENSGRINDYLRYKLVNSVSTEAGEDFGFDKDFRNRSENNKIRR